MSETSSNNKRIAKNTAMLYIRMLLIMAVTLYTSRVVLEVLGVEDFGIYNVVGGIVIMFSFITNSLSGATSRFLTFELGKNDLKSVEKVFRCSITIYYIIGLVIFILAETIGLWFLYKYLVIPPDRINAAVWVYQCSILSFLISLLSVSYNSLIIAHEKMSAFAYISVYETIANLLVVYLISISTFDRLIIYAVLLLVVRLSTRFIYVFYCIKAFVESNSKWLWDSDLSKQLLAYSSWTLNGNLAVVGYTQGINILLNIFFGTIVNAARGIAIQVQGAGNQLLTGFMTAVRPQIVKSYANGDLNYMHQLIINSSRYSFYLILLITIPIFVNVEYILHLWLKEVPEHTANFTRLVLLACLNNSLKEPTIMAIHATGDIKRFQIIEGTLLLTIVPIAYVLLKFAHISAEGVFIVYLIIEFMTQFVRVWIVYPRVQLARKKYITSILFPIIRVLIPLLVVVYALYVYRADSLQSLFINVLIGLLLTTIILFVLGFTMSEKRYILNKLKK